MSGTRRSELWAGLAGLPPSLRFLLATSFVMPLGSFMVLPFLAILLHERLGMAMGTVGVLLGTTSFLQFAGCLGGGLVAERIGLKPAMVTGLVVRTTGFGLFMLGLSTPGPAVAAVLLAAAGDALYSPANKAFLVREVPEEHRSVLLSLNNSALSSGMALGTLVSGLLIVRMPLLVFSVVTVLFAALTLLHAVLLPRCGSVRPADGGSGADWVRAFLTPPAFVAAISAYLYWFFQNYLGVFVTASHPAVVYSLALVVNSVLVIVGQPLAARWIGRVRYSTATLVAFPAFTLGLLAFARAGVPFVLLGTVLVSVGEAVIFLKNELEALRAVPGRPALAVGSQRMALGLGSFTSGIVGGRLYALAQSGGDTAHFWVYVAPQALLVSALVLPASRVVRARRAATGSARSATEQTTGGPGTRTANTVPAPAGDDDPTDARLASEAPHGSG
ncbi:MFS transporter [Streptomyces sp. NPDC001817]|uniref:MFS transporter n=1 Tax=Streptomyces sp. NPDC001817 TaxID=3154398 RepID=UPI003331E59D